MPRPPFDILKWAFVMMAALVIVMMVEILGAGVMCAWQVTTGRAELGACIRAGITDQVREIWELALTTMMALIAIGRNNPPPPDKE